MNNCIIKCDKICNFNISPLVKIIKKKSIERNENIYLS